ncbi:Scr1 family TA system antitoxin-like transcriptional regulator [Actinomycetospora corticicola]|uniref:Transcriptional regulator with XRE-family HTH domain n=1 Tax=Actinomycetospora corticicola TaxID=663602 RepID=A0A7Y9J810_9PSEU|nr:transcriptional regulator with XRE-family HTH domain [Actinomycetospora corticicola]
MADEPTPTTQRRQLGARLRELRRAAGKTAKQVADDLGFSLSKVSRIESGDRAVQSDDISSLIHYFGVGGSAADDMRALARLARRRRTPTPQAFAPTLDDVTVRQDGFFDLERDASWIREFNGGVIPGLLQTREYMSAAIVDGTPGISADLVAEAIDTRFRRQAVLDGDCQYEIIVDESVLLRCVGGPPVMREQISFITDAVASGRVSFGVVPLAVGAHPAVNSMFVSLRVREGLAPDVVFVEGLAGPMRFDRPEDVERFDRAWSHLSSLAEWAEDAGARLVATARRYEGMEP